MTLAKAIVNPFKMVYSFYTTYLRICWYYNNKHWLINMQVMNRKILLKLSMFVTGFWT